MSDRRRERILRRLAVMGLLAILAVFPPDARAGAAPTGLESGTLVVLRWRADALGQTAFGSAVWIETGASQWRLSVADNGPASEDDLLCRVQAIHEIGEGWTVVPSEEGTAVVMPWRGEFSDYGRRVALYLELAMTLLVKGPHVASEDLDPSVEIRETRRSGRRGFGSSRAAGPDERPAVRSLLLPPGWSDNPFRTIADRLDPEEKDAGADADAFRRRMEHRGLGRGDDRETWSLDWDESDGARVLTIKSSRRSGDLSLELISTHPVSFHPDEILVPLWPLAELLESDDDLLKR